MDHEPPNDDGNEDEKRHSDNMAVLAVAAIIIIVGLILFHFISKNLATERCIEEHRRGCGETVEQN
ncbi:MAG TPA: hypothetical protein VG387_18910 [Rhizomicrobium sp.]|jgi:hypothetical protein|nr:hypothetical protein [Rhizomicrobium sp.]